MTTTTSCPDCRTPLTGSPHCAACGLSLTGRAAARLWQVDLELAALEGTRAGLLAERGRLLAELRTPPAPVAGPAGLGAEARPRTVQNTLLAAGALLLALAAVVFAAVTYHRLGVVGRAAVLLGVTAAAATAPVRLRARGLAASAEAVGVVALVLALLDAWALRRAGLATGSDDLSFAATVATLLGAGCAAYAVVVPLAVARVGSVLLAQLPVPLLLAELGASAPVAAGTLAALAALDVVAAVLLPDRRKTGALCAVAAFTASLGCSVLSLDVSGRAAGAALLADAAVLVLTARVLRGLLRAVPAGGAAVLLGAAVTAAVRADLPADRLRLVPLSVALVVLTAAARLRRPDRPGPAAGAGILVLLGLAGIAEPVAAAVLGPAGWVALPWTLAVTGSAADALPPGTTWTGTGLVPVALALSAAGAVAAGVVLQRPRAGATTSGVLLLLAGLVLPAALGLPFALGLALLLGLAAALGAAGLGLVDSRRDLAGPLLLGSAATGLLPALWCTATEGTTLVVLPVAAVLAAGLAVGLGRTWFAGAAVAAAGLLVGAETVALGAAQGLSTGERGGLLLAVPAALVLLAQVVPGPLRRGAEAAAALLGGAAVVLADRDAHWLWLTLAGCGLLTLVVALRADRRPAAVAGGLLLSASSWVRLADAGVHAPEPYVVPLAVLALALGHLRRRRLPGTGSFAAYGPGLGLFLLPSLVAAWSDDHPQRALLLLPAAALVLLVGARTRLRAPLCVGALVLGADGLLLLAPYAASLPRWTLLALLGTALVAVGATYEHRLRDLARLRDRFAALA